MVSAKHFCPRPNTQTLSLLFVSVFAKTVLIVHGKLRVTSYLVDGFESNQNRKYVFAAENVDDFSTTVVTENS